MELQARTKPLAGVVSSQNAATACILRNGLDLPCIAPLPHLTFCP